VTVGPAPIVISMVVGFEIYGLGGALYSTALAVFAMALLDAAARTAPPRPAARPDVPVKPGEPPPAASTPGAPAVSPAAGG
jgi:predicted PurR-regulated permease PerM